MRPVLLAALLAALLPAAVRAEDPILLSGEGDLYAVATDADGYVLTSREGVLRQAGSATLDGPDLLYLGRSCDALAPGEGEGTWGAANGGVLVTLPARTVGFPRQELPALDGVDCPP